MFRFPFGTTQELNLDWFLEQWEIFKQEAQTALDGIDHALDDEIQRVEDAMTDLYAARDAAIAAKNDALNYAQSANSSAIGASQSAQNSAASAVTSAQQAQSAAQSATSAQSSATNAGTSAGNALTQAQQSEAWATGEIGGVHVPPSAPQNLSNAKQFATNAQLSANAANTAKNDARVYSQDSKAWATGIRDGQPVTSEDETYQNNAKYYAESISGDAAAAAQSAANAAASAESVGQSAAQIAQNTADIEELKSSVDYLPSAISAIDIARPLIFTPGYYETPETGTVVNRRDSSARVCAYAPVRSGDVITVYATGGAGYQRLYVFIDASGNAVGTRAGLNLSGKRTITAPEGAVAVAINNDINAQPTEYYAYIGTSLSESAFIKRGQLSVNNTTLSELIVPGCWFIEATILSNLDDKPADIPIRNCFLMVYPHDTGVWQFLWQKDTSYCWFRAINLQTQTVGAWSELRDTRNLTSVQNGDANNVYYNGAYGWGSSDTVSNVPNGVNAGLLINVNRDQNTKYQIAISYQDTHIYVRAKKLGAWEEWNQLVYTKDIAELKPLIKYESGEFDSGKATERLLIYIPCNGHYVAYYFYHYVVPDINCNCWRIYNIYKVSADFQNTTLLTTSGEFECAVKISGRPNFSGGSTHGNEVITGWDLFVNGIIKTNSLSSISNLTEFTEIRFVRQSNLYDPNDSTTIIAEHGCEYVFQENGTLKINQSLKWLGVYSLENCFLAMFTPRKTVSDHGYTDINFTPIALTSDNYTIDIPNAKKAVIYGENTDFCAEFAVERYPELENGNKFRFTDNNGLSYNKCYFFVTENVASTENELWQSTTIYNVKA